jgi:hypothetical protein
LIELFKLPFFELLELTTPYSLQVRPRRKERGGSKKNKQANSRLATTPTEGISGCEEILHHNANLVEAYKASAKATAKRKLLVFGEAKFAIGEAKLERKRQIL